MTAEIWTFDAFSVWLFSKCDALRDAGFAVEIQRHDGPRSSLRLRAESATRVGELTVWNDGMAHEAVLDLRSGDFVYERDGIQLEGDGSSQLAMFFKQTMFM